MKVSSLGKNIRAVIEVEVTGFFVERLINLLKQNGIEVWDVKHISVGVVSFKIESRDFKNIKSYIKKSKCKIKITSKKGIYFEFFRYRKRRMAIYMLMLIFLLYLISSKFIWRVEISGNNRIKTERIEMLLKECKASVGAYKKRISKGKVADYIRANIYDAAWIGVNINGTTMEITVEEKIISTEEDRNIIGDIVAKKDAIITKIVADNGTAKYIAGSYVEKGSILIEGVIESEILEPERVHASGVTRGIVDYTFEKELKLKRSVKENTGKSMHGVGVGINNKEFILKCLPKKYKYDITSKVRMFRFLGVNISFIFNTYEEYILKDIVNTKESLIIQGEKESNLFLNQILTSDSKVKDKNIEIIDTKDGIIYKLTVSVEENIGEFLKTGDK
ncbi:MAG: sporulation protein YqfD [Clostridia bacterium]|nr:sporulation protein YqfD [Clostridia bacterium]